MDSNNQNREKNDLMPAKLLFIDDDANVLHGIRRILHPFRHHWEICLGQSAAEAMQILKSKPVDALICDISMPGKNGFEMLCEVRDSKEFGDIPVLMITGLNNHELKRQALDLGATDLINKPICTQDLIARIKNMLRMKACQDHLKDQNRRLEQQLRDRTRALEAARLDLIWKLGKIGEYRDTDTGNHVLRVGYYAKAICGTLNLERCFAESIFLASPLHDIGKIAIPDHILLKNGKLAVNEWETMKKHTEIGSEVLLQDGSKWRQFLRSLQGQTDVLSLLEEHDNPFLEMAARIALGHHEHWDGGGYPQGLRGEEIALEARIVAIADVYDALLSERPYKPRYPERKALRIMKENAGRQFDPEIFSAFEKSIDAIRDIRNAFNDHQDLCKFASGKLIV